MKNVEIKREVADKIIDAIQNVAGDTLTSIETREEMTRVMEALKRGEVVVTVKEETEECTECGGDENECDCTDDVACSECGYYNEEVCDCVK